MESQIRQAYPYLFASSRPSNRPFGEVPTPPNGPIVPPSHPLYYLHDREWCLTWVSLKLEPRCETAAEMAAQEETLVQPLVEASLSLLDAP